MQLFRSTPVKASLDIVIPRYLDARPAKEASALAQVLTACSNRALEQGVYPDLGALRADCQRWGAIVAGSRQFNNRQGAELDRKLDRLGAALKQSLQGIEQRIQAESRHYGDRLQLAKQGYAVDLEPSRRVLGDKLALSFG